MREFCVGARLEVSFHRAPVSLVIADAAAPGAYGQKAFERLDIWKHAHRGGSVPSEVVFRALTVANLSPDLPTSMKDYHIEVKALRNVTHSLITIQSIMDENEEHSLVAAMYTWALAKAE